MASPSNTISFPPPGLPPCDAKFGAGTAGGWVAVLVGCDGLPVDAVRIVVAVRVFIVLVYDSPSFSKQLYPIISR